jgi:hypothetical protein
MRQATVDDLVGWAATRFSGDDWIGKDEVLAAAAADGLPLDAQRAIHELPQARWSRGQLLERLRTIRQPQERLRMDGPPDGVPGGGHEGEAES